MNWIGLHLLEQQALSETGVRRVGIATTAVLLADALHELPDDHREVIILRQLEGLRFPDVACRLGQTEESVKSAWVQALARLRFTLESLR